MILLEVVLQAENKAPELLKTIEFAIMPGLGDVVTLGADKEKKTYKVMSVAMCEQPRKAVDKEGKPVIGMKVANAVIPYAVLVREIVLE